MAEANVFKREQKEESPKISLRKALAGGREEKSKAYDLLTIRHALKHDVLIVVDVQKVPGLEGSSGKIMSLLSGFTGIIVFSILPGSDIGSKLKEIGHGSHREFFHTGDSVFTDDLVNFLKEKHADNVYLAGIYPGSSISKVAAEGVGLGFDVKVVEDACAPLNRNEDIGPVMESLRQFIGKERVVTVSSLLGTG